MSVVSPPLEGSLEKELERSWIDAWLKPSVYDKRVAIYQDLVYSASKAFANPSISEPRLDRRLELRDPKALDEILSQARQFRIASGAATLAILRAVLLEVAGRHSEGKGAGGKSGLASGVVNTFMNKMRKGLGALGHRSREDWASALLGAFRQANWESLQNHKLVTVCGAKREFRVLGKALLQCVGELQATLNTVDGWARPHGERCGVPRWRVGPRRHELRGLADSFSSHASTIRSWAAEVGKPNEWPANSPSRQDGDPAAKIAEEFDEQLRFVASCRPFDSAHAALEALATSASAMAGTLEALVQQDAAFQELEDEPKAAPAELAECLNVAQDAPPERMPILPRLLLDAIRNCHQISMDFQAAMKAAMVLYTAPGKQGVAFETYVRGSKKAREALEGFKSIDEACRKHYASSKDLFPSEAARCFTSRLWLLAAICRAARSDSSGLPGGSDERYELFVAFLNAVVCRHHTHQGGAPRNYIESLQFGPDGKRMDHVGDFLADICRSLHWELAQIGALGSVRPNSVHRLTNEYGIHFAYSKAPNPSYPLNRHLELIGLTPVVPEESTSEARDSGSPPRNPGDPPTGARTGNPFDAEDFLRKGVQPSAPAPGNED